MGYFFQPKPDSSPNDVPLINGAQVVNDLANKLGPIAEVQFLSFDVPPTTGVLQLAFAGVNFVSTITAAALTAGALQLLIQNEGGDLTDVLVSGSKASGFTLLFENTLGDVPTLQVVEPDTTLNAVATLVTIQKGMQS